MPKAFDDESEFSSEPAKALAKLTVLERVHLIFSGRYLALTVGMLAGVVGLVTSLLFTVISPPRDVSHLRDNVFVHFARVIGEDTDSIIRAQNEILKQLEGTPDSEIKRTILEQLTIIDRSARGLKAFSDATLPPRNDKRSSLSLITSAEAQTVTTTKITPEDVRLYGIIVILVVLGAAFLLCNGIILFSDHARRLTFAIDTVKVLMGFFVGVATSFFGVR
jgi:hypothetical protein